MPGENMMIKKAERRLYLYIIAFMKYMPFAAASKIRNFCYKGVLKKMGRNSLNFSTGRSP